MRGADPAAQLLRALARRGGGVTLLHEGMIAWSSATFIGGQHRVTVSGERLDDWIAGLDEADLPMRGCFVADIAVRRTPDGARLTVLVLEE